MKDERGFVVLAPVHPTKQQISQWCENNLFGAREVNGPDGPIRIPLSRAQQAVKMVAVEVIQKWEARTK